VRAGAIIYSIQASGLGTTYPDAKTLARLGVDMGTGVPGMGADTAIQAPLYTLAVDTGGRALFNSNSLDGSIKQALNETSEYYLLAWRPETAQQRADSFREIQVSVKGHPELTVRVHKGYLTSAPNSPNQVAAKSSATAASTISAGVGTTNSAANNSAAVVEEKISNALSTLYPIVDLPTSVNVRFSDSPTEGSQLMVATEISTGNLFRSAPENRQPRTIDMIGAILNDEGKTVASFRGQLQTTPSAGADQNVAQTTELKTKPGLYQVRVAARDRLSGVTGSASQWILVPDLTKRQVVLSSLFVGVKRPQPDVDAKVPLSISHHFTPNSRLRFFASIYNAARAQDGSSRPDVSVQTRILRDDQAVFTSPVIKVATEGVEDLNHIPYAAEISLRTLASGSYVLQLTATDNGGKSSTTQRVKFIVD
jgi:hypothetical protein